MERFPGICLMLLDSFQMSESDDIAGSEEVILVNNETQDTFAEHSYRPKLAVNRIEKNHSIEQAKENQKPLEKDPIDENDLMQTEPQNQSLPTNKDTVPDEPAPTSSLDTQNTLSSNNPFLIRPPAQQSTLTDGSSFETSMPLKSPADEEKDDPTEPTAEHSRDSNPTVLDTSAAATDLRLYISPSTSLLETTNAEDGPSNADNALDVDEVIEKPKEEPMDTADAQVSLGSDGIIETIQKSIATVEPIATTEKSSVSSPSVAKKVTYATRISYALSQPTTDKFDAILAKLTSSPSRETPVNSSADKTPDPHVTFREEEELVIRESVSKVLRRYTVKVDQQGRTISRDLMNERVVEENTTTRVESWPSPSEKKKTRPLATTARTSDASSKKTTKITTPNRKTKSLKPTSTTASTKKRTKAVLSDGDDDDENEEESKSKNKDTSNKNENAAKGDKNKQQKKVEEEDDDEDDDGDQVTDDVSGEEFIPSASDTIGESLEKGSRIFAKWMDGRFYSGIVSKPSGEKYMIEFDDGAKRLVKPHEIICQSYLSANQSVMTLAQRGYFDQGIIKRIIKKKKSGKLGYVVEKDGKEKWHPLRAVSLTQEQAEHLPMLNHKKEEASNVIQGKRKRTSVVPESPKKKSKSSINISPEKNPRTTFTPTRQTKLFNSMYFLFTGFNDMMATRHEIEESIEKHGGRVIEKMPPSSRRERVYLISDIARKTAKFFEAKKANVPCVNYKWIEASIDKIEVQDWETYKLVLPEKDKEQEKDNTNHDDILDAQQED